MDSTSTQTRTGCSLPELSYIPQPLRTVIITPSPCCRSPNLCLIPLLAPVLPTLTLRALPTVLPGPMPTPASPRSPSAPIHTPWTAPYTPGCAHGTHPLAAPAVRGEVVHGHLHALALLELAEDADEQLEVEGIGVVEVVVAAGRQRLLPLVQHLMAYILHQAPAIHGHGVGGYEQLESAGGCLPGHAPLPGSTSVRAAFVHVVGDLLQSIGVLVAATIIYFKPQCKIADPISTLFFSVFVLGSTLTILRDVFRVLMEGAPRGIEFDAVKEVLLAVSGVRGTHDLHIWALTLSHPVVSVHVAVDASANPETVLREATSQLQSKFGFVSCTVQVERYQEEALGCPHCQDPRA
uniref:Probable proton-coupled zinc antiporter SLC30A3 n=1 Tax=Anas platyrhynchos platyrhynchos TaxID=8840 RepID=A0A493TD34_ANAPP